MVLPNLLPPSIQNIPTPSSRHRLDEECSGRGRTTYSRQIQTSSAAARQSLYIPTILRSYSDSCRWPTFGGDSFVSSITIESIHFGVFFGSKQKSKMSFGVRQIWITSLFSLMFLLLPQRYPKIFEKREREGGKKKSKRWNNCIKPRIGDRNSLQIEPNGKIGKSHEKNSPGPAGFPCFVRLNTSIPLLYRHNAFF